MRKNPVTSFPAWFRLHLPIPALLLGILTWAALEGNAGGASLSPILVPRPIEDQRAIPLPGEIENPAPEEWMMTESGVNPPPGVAKSGVPELIVRNVSHPSLIPFPADRRNATGAAFIVAPGGGFVGLAIEREGFTIAHWLNERGITAFVLKYRVAPTPVDTKEAVALITKWMQDDAQRQKEGNGLVASLSREQRQAMSLAAKDGLNAVRYVRSEAGRWGVSRNRIGFIGFSAGAITTINVAIATEAESRPDLIAPIYGAMPDGTSNTPMISPAFIAAARDDAGVPTTESIRLFSALLNAGVPAELHIFENGGHGFGMLHQGKSSDQWPSLFDHWLLEHGFNSPATQAVRQINDSKG